MRELVRRAQGEYECVACEGGRAALRKVLHKGRERGRILVLVGEEGALVPAVGKDGWEELVDEANRSVLLFDSPRIMRSSTAQLRSQLHESREDSRDCGSSRSVSPQPRRLVERKYVIAASIRVLLS